MRLQIILTVFIVNFGFKHVQSYRRIEEEVVAITSEVDNAGRTHENVSSCHTFKYAFPDYFVFHNLFDSVAKNNDEKKIETYRRALKEEASKEHQVYDVMKDEIQSARVENSYKKINFYEKNNMRENIVPSKRNTPKPPVRGCIVGTARGTFPAGKHSLDVDECIIWYCNYDLELIDYRCKDLRRHESTFPEFYKECDLHGCLW